ncbi:hypothetical protein JTE90_026762 [Oedothorax gibbosus]|uniref:Uncharacterized protein n=1 Tax=Oedothorax gibbosus TaxID=931172 RepID=A0AAV6UXV1_9ARAC|nr:hypothetical protein JTE90_026762 [Oedothorax gibbosus]
MWLIKNTFIENLKHLSRKLLSDEQFSLHSSRCHNIRIKTLHSTPFSKEKRAETDVRSETVPFCSTTVLESLKSGARIEEWLREKLTVLFQKVDLLNYTWDSRSISNVLFRRFYRALGVNHLILSPGYLSESDVAVFQFVK